MPKLSKTRRERPNARPARSREKLDLSDIPEIKQFPPDAVIGKFYRPKKTSVTIRIDADILAWLRASGDGYQTRVNEYLRRMMNRRRRRSGGPPARIT